MSNLPHRPRFETRDYFVAFALFSFAAYFLLGFRPFERPLVLDPATWDYMSVEVTRGLVPYRDIFLHKTPLTMYVGAIGAAVATALSVEAVLGVHAVFVLLGALGPALLYLVCRASHTGLSVYSAAAAAMFMLAFDQWIVASVEGARPKVVTTVLGLACLLSAQKNRALLAGVFGSLATLCWQPGLCFLLGALAELRSRNGLLRILGGSLIPVVALLGYFAVVSAFDDFFRGAVLFNFHYIDRHSRTLASTVARLWQILRMWNFVEVLLLVPALVGFGFLRGRRPYGLLVAGLVYLALCFVSLQAWPDTILFAAPVAGVVGVGLSALASRLFGTRGQLAIFVVAAALVLSPKSTRLETPITFHEQREAFQALALNLDADDTVLTVSLPEFLLHTDRRSVWPWPYMWFGVDTFAAESVDGGFAGILNRLEREPPQLMLIARRWSGANRQSFEQWAAKRYDKRRVQIYPHTDKPISVYELRRSIPKNR